MALQELNYTHSSLYFYGCFKLINSIKKIQSLIKSFSPYIHGFDNVNVDNWNWNNWEIFNNIVSSFLISKSNLSSSFSKYYDNVNLGQGDNSNLMTQFRLTPGIVIQIVQLLHLNGLIKSESDICEFEYYYENEVVIQKWTGLLNKYYNIFMQYLYREE